MNNLKLVSIIIPTYKQLDKLKRSIDSVLMQSYENIEIIVVDDNGYDSEYSSLVNTLMEEYINNKKVKYIKHKVNKNGSAARNTGIRHSNGDYIMFLDDDDMFVNDKIRKQVNKMEELDETWGACYTKYIRKSNGKVVIKSKENRDGNLLVEELMRNLFVHAGSNLLIRRKVIEELNGFDESFIRNQDVEFLTRLLKKYKLAFVDELGLIVDVSSKGEKKIDFISVTEHYIEKFKYQIDNLDSHNKSRVLKMINLQVFRYLLFKKFQFVKAIKLAKKNKISIFLALRYIFHLIRRKITKTAYGFKI